MGKHCEVQTRFCKSFTELHTSKHYVRMTHLYMFIAHLHSVTVTPAIIFYPHPDNRFSTYDSKSNNSYRGTFIPHLEPKV